MKIGQFSEFFHLPVETVRYYINRGLLIPHTKNDRYSFDARDALDMKLILQLKSFRFSLHDIHQIISLKRLSNLDDPHELNDYLAIMNRQKEFLEAENKTVEDTILLLNEEIRLASSRKNTGNGRTTGMALDFLSYLSCPVCQSSLSLENCRIEKQEIYSGVLKCGCGYQAPIEDGVVIGQTVGSERYDGADTDRNCYRMMSPELISNVQKAYLDISEHLKGIDTTGKLILEDFINNYCFCYNNLPDLNPDALYVISDQYPEVVKLYKKLIDKLNLPHRVLFISASSHLLPLKKRCVDVYIDFDSANEYAIFNQGYASDAAGKYFNESAHILGAFFSFPKNSASVRELHRQFPLAWEACFDWNHFQKHFDALARKMIYQNQIGTVTNSGYGESFSYHRNNDPLSLHTYMCK